MHLTRPVRTLYAAAIFLGAFLLFAVEPMAAKRLLPALGGSSAVWITCLVFFQTVLLLGYLYAHALARADAPSTPTAPVADAPSTSAPPLAGAPSFSKGWGLLHVALLALAVLLLLLLPQPDLRTASAHPFTAIFAALGLSIGLPFLLLASTSPLLQVWMARDASGQIPWRLFALSNAGSLLALLVYPSLIEPYLTLTAQRHLWIAGFILYALLCTALALRRKPGAPPLLPSETWETADPGAPPLPVLERWESPLRSRLLWFALPAVASMQLCAVTAYLTQNIAAIPLLWIIPLAAYLVSFIVAFEIPRLYRRWIMIRLLLILLASLGYMLTKEGVGLPIVPALAFFVTELFVTCYFCHAESYALRPASRAEGTLFYLLVASGGAAGSIFIGLLCPLLFDGNYDLGLAFLATAIAIALTWSTRPGWPQWLLSAAIVGAMIATVFMMRIAYMRDTILAERNFYGALRVTQTNAPIALTIRTLTNGTIKHGTQWFAPDFRRTPTTYYAPDSGIGLALDACCGDRPRNLGVVGLGAGTIAAYGRPGDRITFYEINPAVPPIAQNLFTYLRDSPAHISIVLGDARLSLAAEPPHHYDVLVIDAFSGDAIPMHLLTTQAMAVYQRQLAPNGVLAFHISNQFLDLAPEIAALAHATGMGARLIGTPADETRGEFQAIWVLVSFSREFLNDPEIFNAAQPIPPRPGVYPWTDDRSSLLPILRWKVLPHPH